MSNPGSLLPFKQINCAKVSALSLPASIHVGPSQIPFLYPRLLCKTSFSLPCILHHLMFSSHRFHLLCRSHLTPSVLRCTCARSASSDATKTSCSHSQA